MTGIDANAVMRQRATATGLSVAAAAVPYTFQRTLVTRSNLDQAITTGLSFSLHQAIVSTIQDAIQSAALLATGTIGTDRSVPLERWSRMTLALDAAALVAGAGVARAFDRRSHEPLGRATVRTFGQAVAVTGVTGVVNGLLDEAVGLRPGWRSRLGHAVVTGTVAAQREWDRRRRETELEHQGMEPSEISAARSLALGLGVSIGASVIGRFESAIARRTTELVARALPGGVALWSPIGHAASLGILSAGARAGAQRVFRMIEGQQYAVEPAVDVPPVHPNVSGGPGSKVDFHTLSKMGRRFVWTVRSADIIREVTGEEAIAEPVRVYVGLQSADTEEARVALAMDELRRARAFDRTWLMITTPTGTGYGNYAAAGTLELLSLGDCANVVMQYAARPSPISIDRVSDGRSQVRMLVDAIHAELEQRSPADRPTVVMFGESLGAWSSQDAFLGLGAQGLVDAGIDRAIWIGTPMESKWKDQVLGPDATEFDRDVIGVFNDIGEWEAMSEQERARIRFVMITHYNDGVAVFGPSLAVQEPDWLARDAERPPSVPASQRWIPVTSFVQGLIDNKNAARVIPGRFDATGHDYRADLVPFFNAVLDFGADDDRQAAIVTALEREEARRTRWISERGQVGSSMAAVVLERVRQLDPEGFEAAVESVMRDFVTEESDSPRAD
jgi:uncharacterized membrane protein